MLPIQDAVRRCLAHALAPVAEDVLLHDALGRVLFEDVLAPVALPPWHNSAMDGYAVHLDPTDDPDVPAGSCTMPSEGAVVVGPLPVVDTVPAGHAPSRPLGPGEAARVFTGAPLPDGTTAVVMQEETDRGTDAVGLTRRPTLGENIRRAGEDVTVGQRLMRAGDTLTAGRIGLLAAVGVTQVSVARRPRVAIVSTGDEVVPGGQPLGPGQIYSSNTAQLRALIVQAGGIPVDCGIARDTRQSLRAAYAEALKADLIVSTGGVSVGDFDLVRDAMAEHGAEMTFWKVRMKPGKPLAFGVIGGTPTFGLPGNPVSCFVGFLVYVRPVLRKSLGDPRPHLPVVPAILDTPLRKKLGRTDLQRVVLHRDARGTLHARSAGGQGSHVLSTLASAQGLAVLPWDSRGASAGDTVPVMVFEPGELTAAACALGDV